MDDFKIPPPGTRFIYTRRHWPGVPLIKEQWDATVERHYIDDIGEHTVEARRDDGTIETFWNGSFAGTVDELIEIVQPVDGVV